MRISFSVELPPEVASVPVVRSLCRSTLRQLGAHADSIADVALAVTEACANVVLHAREEHVYAVQVDVDATLCRITIIDRGSGFDLAGVPGAQDLGETGRGIALMRALVDRIDFESRPEAGTVVVLEKRLRLADDSPLIALRLTSA